MVTLLPWSFGAKEVSLQPGIPADIRWEAVQLKSWNLLADNIFTHIVTSVYCLTSLYISHFYDKLKESLREMFFFYKRKKLGKYKSLMGAMVP